MPSILIAVLIFSSILIADDSSNARQELQEFVLRNYGRLSEGNLRTYGRFCAGGNNVDPSSDYCVQMRDRYGSVLTQFSRLLSRAGDTSVTPEQSTKSLYCVPPGAPETFDIESLLQSLNQARECAPLAVGEFKRFPMSFAEGRHHRPFLLKRRDANNLEATVQIDFRPSDGARLDALAMQSRVQGCLDIAAPYLNSGGQNLRVRLINPQEAQTLPTAERPDASVVEVANSNVTNPDGSPALLRDHSALFGDASPCEVLVHEILHHLGLCDEYADEPRGGCRVSPNVNTIMGDSFAAWADMPHKRSCSCGTENCRTAIRNMTPETESIMGQQSLGDVISGIARYCRTEELPPSSDIDQPARRYLLLDINTMDTEHTSTFESRKLRLVGNKLEVERRRVTCSCNPSEEFCRMNLVNVSRRAQKLRSAVSCPDGMWADQNPPVIARGESSRLDGNNYVLVSPERRTSFITPNHFDRIMNGNCAQGAAGKYNICADASQAPVGDRRCTLAAGKCDDQSFLGTTQQ
jgi:hypothetical protein